MLYPLSYEGGGFESVSARIGALVVGAGAGCSGALYIRPLGLGASMRLVYLGLILDDKGGRYCGIPRSRGGGTHTDGLSCER